MSAVDQHPRHLQGHEQPADLRQPRRGRGQLQLRHAHGRQGQRLQRLLANPAIIRSERKLRAAADNARAFLRIQEEFGSFDAYLWGFAPGAPFRRAPGAPVPAQTPLSQEISRDLRRRGMKFVGPVIVYSFLQSVGVVNDHDADCAFA